LAFTFQELKFSFKTNSPITQSTIKQYEFKKIRLSDRTFYQREQMCKFIQESIHKRARVFLPAGYNRSDFFSLNELQIELSFKTPRIKELIASGYLPGTIIYGKRNSIFINQEALNRFHSTYLTIGTLAKEYSLGPKAVYATLKKHGILPSSKHATPILPYLFNRNDISIHIRQILANRSNEMNVLRARKKHTAWTLARLINIEQNTLTDILKSNLIPELSALYTPKINSFSNPEAALYLLRAWRSENFTNAELAARFNVNANLITKRFKRKDTTKPKTLGKQLFYTEAAAEEIERQLQSYVSGQQAVTLANLTLAGFRNLIKTKLVKAIDPDHPAYCPTIKLYNISEILINFDPSSNCS
jgi:hypothetical protein